jgi:hypothetical protein
MKTIEEIVEESRERERRLAEQEREELWEWINMPAYKTENEIEKYSKIFLKRRYNQPINIIIRLVTPNYSVESTWRCYLFFSKKDGTKLYEEKASKGYCKQIFSDKSWHE